MPCMLTETKNRDLACTVGGMLGLLAGRKLIGLGLFAKGFAGLEASWRRDHDFHGSWAERWQRAQEHYEATHTHPMNRALHTAGIPLILGGALGMLAFKPYRPFWAASAGSFTFGWALNFIGHGVYEKNAPAFAEDPLSFLAGPVWDLQRLQEKLGVRPKGILVKGPGEPSEAAA